jgi:hypothetical protein
VAGSIILAGSSPAVRKVACGSGFAAEEMISVRK